MKTKRDLNYGLKKIIHDLKIRTNLNTTFVRFGWNVRFDNGMNRDLRGEISLYG